MLVKKKDAIKTYLYAFRAPSLIIIILVAAWCYDGGGCGVSGTRNRLEPCRWVLIQVVIRRCSPWYSGTVSLHRLAVYQDWDLNQKKKDQLVAKKK
jgi:hypothetical protein